MNFTSMYLWVTQKISTQYEHFYYIIYNIEKNNFLADVYVSSALGGYKKILEFGGMHTKFIKYA
jgi:hypothetical protein